MLRSCVGALVICMASFFVARSTGKSSKKGGGAAAPVAGGSGEPRSPGDLPGKQGAGMDVEAAAAAEGDEEDRPLLAAVREGLGRRRTTSDQDVRGSA